MISYLSPNRIKSPVVVVARTFPPPFHAASEGKGGEGKGKGCFLTRDSLRESEQGRGKRGVGWLFPHRACGKKLLHSCLLKFAFYLSYTVLFQFRRPPAKPYHFIRQQRVRGGGGNKGAKEPP